MKGNEQATWTLRPGAYFNRCVAISPTATQKPALTPTARLNPRMMFQLAEPPVLPAWSEESYTSHERRNLVSNTLAGAAPQACRMCAGWVLDNHVRCDCL
jgi:hypothetical protein